MKKLKIEFAKKLSEIESENIKQKNIFDEAQKAFDDSKNNSLEDCSSQLKTELINS